MVVIKNMNFPGNILQNRFYKNFVVDKMPLVYSDEKAKKRQKIYLLPSRRNFGVCNEKFQLKYILYT
jgi:hypothetical protein